MKRLLFFIIVNVLLAYSAHSQNTVDTLGYDIESYDDWVDIPANADPIMFKCCKSPCCSKSIDSILGKIIWFIEEGRVQKHLVHNIILSDSTVDIYATIDLGRGWWQENRIINLNKTIWSTDSLQQQIVWTKQTEQLDRRIKLRKSAEQQMLEGQKILDSLNDIDPETLKLLNDFEPDIVGPAVISGNVSPK